MKRAFCLLSTAVTLSLATLASAQSPTFSMPPFVIPGVTGSQITWSIDGAIPHPFAILADLSGGPVDLFGERFYLGFSPVLTTLSVSPLSTGPVQQTISIPTVPGMLGVSIYGQPVVFDALASNGVFRTLNGASTTYQGAGSPTGSAFDDPIGEGFTGNFRADVAGHIRGGAVLRRTHETIDPQGMPFFQGLQNPLHPQGSREQMVFRTQDVGATGEPELLVAVRWKPLGLVTNGTIHDIEMRIGHTAVVPDYRVDNFSALPIAPNSGLDALFASNYLPGAHPVSCFRGRYDIDPTRQTGNGYLPYPSITPFAYDGVSSLLLEFLVADDPLNFNITGAAVRIMVQSSPLPGARLWASGTPFQPMPIPMPSQVTQGIPDNAMHELELDFARVQTYAQSPWIDSQNANPDYDPPVMAASIPNGSSLRIEYRGSASANGASPTAWSLSQDVADGSRYLQFRLTFVANLFTGESPIVDTLAVPAH